MSRSLVHLVPGPEEHGVARHGLGVHPHLGEAELLRCDRLDELPDAAVAGRVVLAQVTDRLLAPSPDQGLEQWRRVLRGAVRVTVVLHDLPQRSDGRHRRARSELYAGLAASADTVVVASAHERLLLAAALRWARPDVATAVLDRTEVVPLPVEPDPGAAPRPSSPTTPPPPLTVVTLGFVYPGKGLEEVVDAVALAARDPRLQDRAVEVVNLGGASQGHEDLLEELAGRAREAGVRWHATGYVPDEALPGLLAAATVPVAAHRHVSASGSVATWLAAGRRPLLLDSRYARELADRLPGTVRTVPEDGLAPALAEALVAASSRDGADPTWSSPDVRLGPTWEEAGGRVAGPARQPAVSVVVPYYRDQELLDLLVARLAAQTGVRGGLELVVADDGSPRPPTLPAAPHGALGRIRVLRQPDEGFRLAAARNLGLGAATGRVLVLLDGDTVPEDGYVAALQRVCVDAPTLAVGRRRHADLRRHPDLRGEAHWPPSAELPAPAWLAEGYAGTQDLRSADDTSFRFVIGAVTGVSRAVLDAVGGFEGRLTGYGGEDWEFAWRCWLAGADLRHVPDAVAWHDGPDVAGRADAAGTGLAGVKNAETARLAHLLPHPLVRGRGWTYPQPDVVVDLDVQGWTPGQVLLVVESVLRQGDVGVWLTGTDATAGHETPGPGDGLPPDLRLHRGRLPAAVLARARAEVRLTRPVWVHRLPWRPWPARVDVPDPSRSPWTEDPASGVQVRVTRGSGRARLQGVPSGPCFLDADAVEPVPPDVVVEHWRAAHP
ncbi:glycosyltransferase [Serinicoccus chungangensis]|uniref:glycosyltransferase n=1 Tax=Serinicoccus chungangensis TaxID=767452 RepID=UPI00128EF012|nr:glycosyltransferase [Serinicoccus chungangensis]